MCGGLPRCRTLLLLVLAMACGAVAAGSRIPQLAEDGVRARRLAAGDALIAATPGRVCEPGAKWIRLGFSELTLRSYDTLVLESSGGDRYVFDGRHWNGRRFHARALRGSCVAITPYFGHPDSRYRIESYQFGTIALESLPVVAAGAGDICDSTPTDCGKTSDLIVAINPTVVFTAGDNAYSSGTLAEYTGRYDPNWGRFKALTSPTPGNHDYLTTGAAGYFDYFNGVGEPTGPAGDRSRGYYSFDVGEWHFIALNTMSGGTISSTQLAWLEADLAANTKPCTAAYFHHPLLSRGVYGGSSTVRPLYDRLYAARADLVLVGHDHNYQRYAKMTPGLLPASDGLRQIIVGTGGRDFYALNGTHALLEAAQAHTWGVLRLELTATGYSGEFVPVAGKTWTDSFSGTCNNASQSNAAPTAGFSFSTDGLAASFTDTSTDSDGSVVARSWNFGDGATSTATNPDHTYAAAGTYSVTLTVTDDDGDRDSLTRSVTVATNSAPTASFTYSTRGLTVTLINRSTDSDGTIVGRLWDFGDGGTSTGNNVTHTYAAPGPYPVKLTVTDDDGATGTITRWVRTPLLTGTDYRVDGAVSVDLEWTGAGTKNVDIYRDGRKIRTTANDGAYTDATGWTGTGTVSYRVCEASRSVCTNTINLSY